MYYMRMNEMQTSPAMSPCSCAVSTGSVLSLEVEMYFEVPLQGGWAENVGNVANYKAQHRKKQIILHSIYTINLLTDATLGGAYEEGTASPVDQQGHVICCSGQ